MSKPDNTDHGHYVLIGDRRWRATGPSIPEDRRNELARVLMAWRREVRSSKGTPQELAARAGLDNYVKRWRTSLHVTVSALIVALLGLAAN